MTTKARQYFSIALALLILFGGWWYFKSNPKKEAPAPVVKQDEPEKKGVKGLVVESPQSDAVVSFPLTVKGNITGEDGWIAFEGQTGTVQVFDQDDLAVSSVVPLTATEDWMQSVVHFETIVASTATSTAATSGYLKFTAENPSGEGAGTEYRLPVKFK